MDDATEAGVGYRIDASGEATEFDWRAGPAPRDEAGFDWIHLNLHSDAARSWLTERSGLEPIVVDALLEDETRPRSLAIGDGLVVILRGVNLNPGADPEDMVALRIWAEEGRVITGRRRPLMAVGDLMAAVGSGRGPRNAGDFLVEIADRLIARMSGVLTNLNESVDAVEESLVESPVFEQRSELTVIRRQAIALRRYLGPQRDALAQLYNERVAWISDAQRLHFREVTDATIRFVEDLEAARERTAITQEELNGQLAEQLNRRMYALSIVAGIFLPLGFITGLLGINVGGIPGGENPLAFAIVCVSLSALGGGLVLLFRRLHWL
jgi:zinc transporter